MAEHLPPVLLEACVVIGASGDKLREVYQVFILKLVDIRKSEKNYGCCVDIFIYELLFTALALMSPETIQYT